MQGIGSYLGSTSSTMVWDAARPPGQVGKSKHAKQTWMGTSCAMPVLPAQTNPTAACLQTA